MGRVKHRLKPRSGNLKAVFGQKPLFLGALLAIGAVWAGSALVQARYDSRLADAIYKAEGGDKATMPYGILSVKVHNKAEARRICLNSIRNARARWVRAGRPGDFIEYMGQRYSPPATNPNWVRLVKYFMARR